MKLFRILLVLFFFSCATQITMDQIQTIDRGTTHKELKSKLQKNPIIKFDIEFNNFLFLIETYPMQTGIKTSSYYVAPTKYTAGGVRTQKLPVTSEYIFIFKDGLLFYWGFLNELYKSDNREIIKLIPMISNKLENSL